MKLCSIDNHNANQYKTPNQYKIRKNNISYNEFYCSVAYDIVNLETLITKRNHYGIRETALDWFKSHFANRTEKKKLVEGEPYTETVITY